MLGPGNWGFKRVTLTGSGIIDLTKEFPGTTFASINEFICFVESGRAVIAAPVDITVTSITVTNNLSPSADATIIIIPLRSL